LVRQSDSEAGEINEFQTENSNRPEDIGLHVVGVSTSGTSLLQNIWVAPSILDWKKFSAKLVQEGAKDTPTPAKRIWDLLTEKTRNQLRLEAEGTPSDSPEDRKEKMVFRQADITDCLNRILVQRQFYCKEHFRDVPLNSAVKEILELREDLTALEVRRLNRLLWEAAFPREIAKSELAKDLPETVRVRVMRTTRPIVLVLTSYNSVRWVVVPEKNVKIKQIIVGGYHPQEITGVDAPVVFKIYESKDGPNKDYLLAHTEEEQYLKMKRKLRELTGLEVFSFQYESDYDGVPFEVRD
jgi:hypothetical protein